MDASLAMGYIRLDRPGDLAWCDMDCEECGQPCEDGAWAAVMGDGTLLSPLCSACACSD